MQYDRHEGTRRWPYGPVVVVVVVVIPSIIFIIKVGDRECFLTWVFGNLGNVA